ncbi:MAG: hypothetical protein WCH94_05305 [Actinomycetota bacterium]
MPASQDESINDMISRLESISEELADKALDALKSAHREGAIKRPETERQLTTARRAIEKAIGLLTRLD